MRKLLLTSILLFSSCATNQVRVTPTSVQSTLIQLHGAVSQQYIDGGMELEHFLQVNAWIGDELRIIQNNPKQWEGQARLNYLRIRSILVPYENLVPILTKLDGMIQ